MTIIIEDISRTVNEYLLLPNLTDERCIPEKVDLKKPIVKYKKNEEKKIKENIQMVYDIMKSV